MYGIGEKRPCCCIDSRDHSICLYNTSVSSHQLYTWDHGPLYLSIQHHGLFSLITYMRTGTSLSVYNTMVSSHQLYSWDHGPLYLSIQHHGLFSPIPYMRPGTTLSVNTTSWSLLTNPIHENSHASTWPAILRTWNTHIQKSASNNFNSHQVIIYIYIFPIF
jgi:hypothetical protein